MSLEKEALENLKDSLEFTYPANLFQRNFAERNGDRDIKTPGIAESITIEDLLVVLGDFIEPVIISEPTNASLGPVYWEISSESNEGVLTIDLDNRIMATAVGTCTLTLYLTNGIKATCDVMVTCSDENHSLTITFNPKSLVIVEKEPVKLKYALSGGVSGTGVYFVSSDEAVLTVSGDVITPIAEVGSGTHDVIISAFAIATDDCGDILLEEYNVSVNASAETYKDPVYHPDYSDLKLDENKLNTSGLVFDPLSLVIKVKDPVELVFTTEINESDILLTSSSESLATIEGTNVIPVAGVKTGVQNLKITATNKTDNSVLGECYVIIDTDQETYKDPVYHPDYTELKLDENKLVDNGVVFDPKSLVLVSRDPVEIRYTLTTKTRSKTKSSTVIESSDTSKVVYENGFVESIIPAKTGVHNIKLSFLEADVLKGECYVIIDTDKETYIDPVYHPDYTELELDENKLTDDGATFDPKSLVIDTREPVPVVYTLTGIEEVNITVESSDPSKVVYETGFVKSIISADTGIHNTKLIITESGVVKGECYVIIDTDKETYIDPVYLPGYEELELDENKLVDNGMTFMPKTLLFLEKTGSSLAIDVSEGVDSSNFVYTSTDENVVTIANGQIKPRSMADTGIHTAKILTTDSSSGEAVLMGECYVIVDTDANTYIEPVYHPDYPELELDENRLIENGVTFDPKSLVIKSKDRIRLSYVSEEGLVVTFSPVDSGVASIYETDYIVPTPTLITGTGTYYTTLRAITESGEIKGECYVIVDTNSVDYEGGIPVPLENPDETTLSSNGITFDPKTYSIGSSDDVVELLYTLDEGVDTNLIFETDDPGVSIDQNRILVVPTGEYLNKIVKITARTSDSIYYGECFVVVYGRFY